MSKGQQLDFGQEWRLQTKFGNFFARVNINYVCRLDGLFFWSHTNI